MAVTDAVALEGDSLTFKVTVSHALSLTEDVSIPYTLVDGTAALGTDYSDPSGGTDTSGTLTFKAGATEADLVIPTLLDAANTSSETFGLDLGDIVQAHLARGDATGTIRGITGSLTIFNPDGTPDWSGGEATLNEGDCLPMEVKLTSPAAVDGTFSLDYDPTYFQVTSDAAGDDVVNPGDSITPSTGGVMLYLWGEQPIDGSTPDIALLYDAASSQSDACMVPRPVMAAHTVNGLPLVQVGVAVDAPSLTAETVDT